MQYPQAIRDSIHGYIRLTDAEVQGINCRELQRLRHVRQLGLTDQVYPGASHSRFEHALGTLEMATRTLEELRGRDGIDGLLPALGLPAKGHEYEQLLRTLRWVALLHDVGHPPFSHVTEGLLPADLNHEELTVELVHGGRVGEILHRDGVEVARDVVTVLRELSPRGTPQPLPPSLDFVRQLIAGPIGADRMDYLSRDSAATGVSYGVFDAGRILHTLVVVPNADGTPRLGIERGGVLAVEGMLWGRLSMFQQVYLHRTRRILDRHLTDYLRVALPDGCYPRESASYLEWTDPRVWEMLRIDANDERAPGHRDARRVLHREHHRTLPQELEGSDRATLHGWLAEWAARIREAVPAADPIQDVVSTEHRAAEIPVRTGNGEIMSLREVSSLLVGLRLRPTGRMYVDRGVADVPGYP
ncbi:MAG: HD domain-containing protein [Planctomycetota bacterium]